MHTVASNYPQGIQRFPHWFETMVKVEDDEEDDEPRQLAPLVLPPSPERIFDDAQEKAKKSKFKIKLKSKNLTRLHIEPKTFLANERTFLRWLTLAVLVCTMSTSLIRLSKFDLMLDHTTGITSTNIYNAERMLGTLMSPFSLFMVLYSYYMYTSRLWHIKNRFALIYFLCKTLPIIFI